MIALDICGTEIKVVQLNGRKIIRWGSAALPASVFSNGKITDYQVVADAVRRLLTSTGIRGRKVTLCFSGVFSVSRVIDVIYTSGRRASERTREAVEVAMQLPAEEFYLAWNSLWKNGTTNHLLVFGFPKDILDSHMAALKGAVSAIQMLDSRPLAIARSTDSSDAIILNVDATSYDIIIVRGNVPEIMHTAAWQPAVLSDIDRVEKLSTAVRLALGRYETTSYNSAVSPPWPFYVTGSFSEDAEFVQALEERLGFSHSSINLPLEYPPNFPVSVYAASVGMAAGVLGLSKHSAVPRSGDMPGTDMILNSLPRVNLLPNTYRPWRPNFWQVALYVCILLGLALLIPFLNTVLDEVRATDLLRQRQNDFKVAAERRDLEVALQKPLLKEIADYEALIAQNGRIVDDLLAVNRIAVRQNVQVTNLVHNGSSVNFTCLADTYLVFREFIKELEGSGRFGHPVIPPEGYPFISGGSVRLTPLR